MSQHDLTLVRKTDCEFVEGEQPEYIRGAAGVILVVCPKTGYLINATWNAAKRSFCNSSTGELIDFTLVTEYYRLFYTNM